MARPTSMQIELPGRLKGAGITVEVYPSTVRALQVELQAATANSTASTVWSSHIFGPSTAGPLRYTVKIPESTRLYYFRARHPAGNGYSAGPFLPTISARPKVTPDVLRPFFMQMTYQGNIEAPSGSDVFVSSAKTVRVGTQPTTGNVLKVVRYPHPGFRPLFSVSPFSVSNAYMYANNTTASIAYQCPVVLQPGVVIRQIRVRGNRASTLGTLVLSLIQAGPASTVTVTLASVTITSGGLQTKESTAVTNTYSTAYSYYLQSLLRDGTTALRSQFLWGELTYRMPDYQKAV